MTPDPFLPVAPARVKTLVLPIGRIKRDRFDTFVKSLNTENVVQLRDVTADGRPNRNMFTPLAFPDGAMFYDLMTHVPPPSHLALVPFDLYREPLALLAIADGSEINNIVLSKRQSGGRTVAETNIRSLDQELEDLRDRYPRILVHQVLLFDYVPSEENPIPIPEGIVTIPPPEQHKRTTMKTVMCDISSLILAEMTTLAKSYEGMTFIDSPGHASTAEQMYGGQGHLGDPARRNSQFALPTNRSVSASGLVDRGHQARMSMPPVPFKGGTFGNRAVSGQPATPPNGRSGLSKPPTNFDDITGGESASPEKALPPRPDFMDVFRTQSQDRVSVQGFGSGGSTDKKLHRGKSRFQIVLGSLYLQAGRWIDALRELTEGATGAKSTNDHIWHGKALELSLVALLLLGWAGIEFDIHPVLLPSSDKGTALANQIVEAEQKDPEQPRWLRRLQVYIPELLDRIISLYSRITAENLQPLPMSETIIRFCRMLTALHVADGKLDERSLEMMVLGTPPPKQLTTSPRFTITPTRPYILATLMKAYPGSASELLTTADRIVLLSGIASVLGVLGFQRKKAMVVKDLVSVLIGGLVEARTRGAADVGIHPAAGLVGLNGLGGNGHAGALDLTENDIEQGIGAFLGLLLRTYGVVTDDPSPPASLEDAASRDDSDEAAVARILKQSDLRNFGIQDVKLNILRMCISFSEALPDFAGVLKYSSDLLRTAGSGTAPGLRREDAYPAIHREDQIRFATNISKTSNLAKRLGMGHLAAEYWDEFLLRGVKLEPLPTTRTPVSHARSELPNAVATTRTSQDVNPFIYNPFLKQPDAAAVEKVLVAGEAATFRLTFQNTFEMDLELESIRLDTEGPEFESAVESLIVGPYRTQVLRISGVPKAAGTLRIRGAIIKVRGCRERRFPIFIDQWAPEKEPKVKGIGLVALDVAPAKRTPPTQRPKPESLELNVIAEQPVVVVKSSTLPQSSVMILEGERQKFSVTLQNLSTTTPVDFLLFSFQDSTQEPLQAAMASRDATPAELYEYELILAKKQALRIRKEGNQKRYIPPGGTATFDFEILGKSGLTHGLIQVDYAYLGVPPDELEGERFFTRQVSLALTVTVNASIEIVRMDVFPLHGSIPEPLWLRAGSNRESTSQLTADTHCLLMLDLRNAWPSNMVVQLESEDGARLEEHILPGNVNRVIFPIKRVYLEDPYAFIPVLNPSRQRQFIVSSKLTPEMERANREAFWYREKVLDSLKGTWRTGPGAGTIAAGRSGSIELRSMRLTSRMIEAVKVDEIGIEISVLDASASPSPQDEQEQKHKSHAIAKVESFLQLRVAVTNRTNQPIYPLVRLMPSLCHRPLNVALDFTRKFAWNGTLQKALPLLAGGHSAEVIMGVTVLCRGEFEISASVEETMVWRPSEEEEEERRKRRSEMEKMQDAAMGMEIGGSKRERRVWCSRRPARVVVVRNDEDE
ncbi:TRAPP II complex [Sordaria brevicollis]|uniref:TRAPP II complex n=1 Tax=Sordaria brevicollis TaxID=83679 RepID=A0AAE0PN94_SORBR|nr:TRAPP II complex [Sordaria brevicollis]